MTTYYAVCDFNSLGKRYTAGDVVDDKRIVNTILQFGGATTAAHITSTKPTKTTTKE